MLSREENELVTRVGPGTPMGNAMRALLDARAARRARSPNPTARRSASACSARTSSPSATAKAASACSRSSARIAASRCISGATRNAACAASITAGSSTSTGACVDMMNEPEENDFKHKVRAHRLSDRANWAASSGPISARPRRCRRCRNSPGRRRRKRSRHVTKVIEECNWLQALEGGIDTSHAPILHRLLTDSSTRGGIKPSNPFVRGKAPKLVVDITDYGYQYAGIRPLGRRRDVHIRTYHFIMPFHQIRPSRSESGLPTAMPATSGCRSMTTTAWSTTGATVTDGPLTEEDRLERGLGNGPLHVDPTTFRSKANRSNDYMLDRDVQRTETLLRHRRHQRAGPCVAGEHGADRRSLEGASRPGRQGDHPGAQAAASGGEDRGGRAARRTAPAPATTRCAPTSRCCQAARIGARSWRQR